MSKFKCGDCGEEYYARLSAENCSYGHRIDEAFQKLPKPYFTEPQTIRILDEAIDGEDPVWERPL